MCCRIGWPDVSGSQSIQIPDRTPKAPNIKNGKNSSPFEFRKRKINGEIIPPILPMPDVKPTPLLLTSVGYNSDA